jgi:hypothetical protein
LTRVDRKGRHRSEFQPDERFQGKLDRPEYRLDPIRPLLGELMIRVKREAIP